MTKQLSILLLVLFVVTAPKNLYSQKKNNDPFARSARLPDFSVGMLFNANTMVKYKVPGGSLAFNSTYYDFDRRFLVGVEVAKNIMQHKASVLTENDPIVIADQSLFRRLIYNQTIYGLRGGWMFRNTIFITVGTGVELLDQFRESRGKEGAICLISFCRNQIIKLLLFYTKYGIQYKHKYWIYDFFYSSRGLGVGINYFLMASCIIYV